MNQTALFAIEKKALVRSLWAHPSNNLKAPSNKKVQQLFPSLMLTSESSLFLCLPSFLSSHQTYSVIALTFLSLVATFLWEQTPEPSIFRTINFTRSVSHVTWSPDSKYLLLNLGYDGWHKDFIYELQVVEIESGELLFTRPSQDSTCSTIVSDVAWFPDSQRFLYTDDRGRLSIYVSCYSV